MKPVQRDVSWLLAVAEFAIFCHHVTPLLLLRGLPRKVGDGRCAEFEAGGDAGASQHPSTGPKHESAASNPTVRSPDILCKLFLCRRLPSARLPSARFSSGDRLSLVLVCFLFMPPIVWGNTPAVCATGDPASQQESTDKPTEEPAKEPAKKRTGLAKTTAAETGQSSLSRSDLAAIVPPPNWLEAGVRMDLDAIFRQRLEFYGNCLQRWVRQEAQLTPHQVRLLSEQVSRRVEAIVPLREQLASAFLEPSVPILFAKRGASRMDSVLSSENLPLLQLSRQQVRRLEAALALRQQQLRGDNLAGVLFLAESELFLTSEQARLTAELASELLNLDDHGFTFFLPDWMKSDRRALYYPKQSLKDLMHSHRIASTLTSHQAFLLNDQAAQEREFPVSRRKLLKGKAGLFERQSEYVTRLDRAMGAAWIDLLGDQVSVSESDKQLMQMATARLSDKTLRDWIQSSRTTYLEESEFYLNQRKTFAPIPPERTRVFVSEQLQSVREAIPGGQPLEIQRTAHLRMRLTHFLRGLMDRELWLTSEQRAQLCEPLSQVIRPEWTMPAPSYSPTGYWALECASLAILGLSATEPAGLLREQELALVALRRLFDADHGFYAVPAPGPYPFLQTRYGVDSDEP